MICLDCGNRDIRYDEKEKSYHCNNCGSRELGNNFTYCIGVTSENVEEIANRIPVETVGECIEMIRNKIETI